MFKLIGFGHKWYLDILMKKKMHLIEHNPQDDTSTDCSYRALVRDGKISIKGTHMIVSMIFLKANRMEVFGGNGYNAFLKRRIDWIFDRSSITG
jgi:hypothetical protein